MAHSAGETEAKEELGVRLQVMKRQRSDETRLKAGSYLLNNAQKLPPSPTPNSERLEGLALCRPPRPSGELGGLRP